MKNFFLLFSGIFIFFLFFFFFLPVTDSQESEIKDDSGWEETIIDTDSFRLVDGRLIRILGIDGPKLNDPRHNYACFRKKTLRFLKEILSEKEIKMVQDVQNFSNQGTLLRHVKIKNKNIAELLLSEGLVSFSSDGTNTKYEKQYKDAEALAQKNKLGIWSNCDQFSHHADFRFSIKNKKKYVPYLSQISVGKVKEVLSGQSFIMENGIVVKLLGIETPDSGDPRQAFSCFGKYAKEHLEDLILGKKVFLLRDQSDFTNHRELLRYIDLPLENRGQDHIFINEKMVADGFARSMWEYDENQKFQTLFLDKETEAEKNMTGAWGWCLQEIINESGPFDSGSGTSAEADPDCKIKGNVSGTKKNPILKYHTPASRWYKNLKYERCFETQEDAMNAGFVKVK